MLVVRNRFHTFLCRMLIIFSSGISDIIPFYNMCLVIDPNCSKRSGVLSKKYYKLSIRNFYYLDQEEQRRM